MHNKIIQDFLFFFSPFCKHLYVLVNFINHNLDFFNHFDKDNINL